jgi:methylenetetrahydrofolate dehydrogenase (NADP+)/methenyltetrahydrofolate cyclohydrolase
MTKILHSEPIYTELVDDLRKNATGTSPTLAVISFGMDNCPNGSIIRSICSCAGTVGVEVVKYYLEPASTVEDVKLLVKLLNSDDGVTAILPLAPFPSMTHRLAIANDIHPIKDVDGVGLLAGSSTTTCVSTAVLQLLDYYKVPVEGRKVTVLGASKSVGMPIALALHNRGAVVTVCNSKTRDVEGVSRAADVLVSAVGKSNFVTKDFVKPGAVVIDVGICTGPREGVTGDVDLESVKNVASAVSPVPGGVGPLTVATIFQQVVYLAQHARNISL